MNIVLSHDELNAAAKTVDAYLAEGASAHGALIAAVAAVNRLRDEAADARDGELRMSPVTLACDLIVHPVNNNEGLHFRGPGVDDELYAGGRSTFEVTTTMGRRLAFTFEPDRPIWMHNAENVAGVWSCSYYRPNGKNTPTMLARLLPGERIELVRNTTHV
ncbi:endonuclease [Mycobacterium phage Patt]|uniref:Uncharacterized protein n=1 Tax=Mycobacterium phage Patt TaxID=2530139 RepID=A0A481VRI9_9CAUD|nr:endonuclease [Mycobacterium phage Patt]QBI96283.1 hypothetical protein SEA_PATT_50 [Mycobacterium phage Patt]